MWITLTAADVLDEFNDSERDGYQNAQGATKTLDRITGHVVARVRGAVLAGGGVLGVDGTIPDALAGEAIAVARWRFLLALPRNPALQSAERKATHDQALEVIKDVSTGKLRVEVPTETSTTQTSDRGATIIRSTRADQADTGFDSLAAG